MKIMSCGVDGVMAISQVRCDEVKGIQILSGPLKCVAENVVKFDLHKRIAKVALSFKQSKVIFHFGIDIVN